MKNDDRACPCDTLIITNVNRNNEENGKVFTWVKLKLFKYYLSELVLTSENTTNYSKLKKIQKIWFEFFTLLVL